MATDTLQLTLCIWRVCSQGLCTKYLVISPKGFLYSFIGNLAEKHQKYSTSNKKAIYVIYTAKAIPGEFSEIQLQVMKQTLPFKKRMKSWSSRSHKNKTCFKRNLLSCYHELVFKHSYCKSIIKNSLEEPANQKFLFSKHYAKYLFTDRISG